MNDKESWRRNKIYKDMQEENANLNQENDRLNDELENLKEAYGGENAKLKQDLAEMKRCLESVEESRFNSFKANADLEEELSNAKSEALIKDKAFYLSCRYLSSIRSKIIIQNDGWRTNTETIGTIMENYLSEASKND